MTSRGKLMVSMSIKRGMKAQNDNSESKNNNVKRVKYSPSDFPIENNYTNAHLNSDTPSDSESGIRYESDDSLRDPDWKCDNEDRASLSEYDDNTECERNKRKHSRGKSRNHNSTEVLENDNNNNVITIIVTNTTETQTIVEHKDEVSFEVENHNSTEVIESDINNNIDTHHNDITTETAEGTIITVTNIPEAETLIDHEEEVSLEADKRNPQKAKKGMGNPDTWTRNVNKKLRMQGKAYKGVTVVDTKASFCADRPERILCERSCSRRCDRIRKCGLIREELRQEIFKAFWNKMEWNEKKVFVSSNVNRIESNTVSTNSRRKFTYKYHFRDGDNKVQVCKQMFLSTLGISEHTVYEWLRNIDDNGLPEENETQKALRSKTRQSAYNGNQSVKDFLESLPKLPSHYCRATSQKEHLEPIYLSLSHLYKIYMEHCINKEYKAAGVKFFTKVFNEMNLALFRPKKDQCDVCVGYETQNVSEEVYREHVRRKTEARQEKENDNLRALDNGKLKVLTMDVQAVLLCPKVEANAMYYKTKLACHNFTIYNLASKQVAIYFWHEGEGGLTANSFASCINDHLQTIVDDTTEEVIIYTAPGTRTGTPQWQIHFCASLLNTILQSVKSFWKRAICR